jgi:hypothetical protein
MLICLNPGLLQAKIVRIGPAAHSEQDMRTNYLGIAFSAIHANCNLCTVGLKPNTLSTRSNMNVFLL